VSSLLSHSSRSSLSCISGLLKLLESQFQDVGVGGKNDTRPLWNHVTVLWRTSAGMVRFKCKYCAREFNGGYRVKS
jgi:hypothetical protein